MHLAKKYTHYIARTDAPAKIVPCLSLADARETAETITQLAHYSDTPSLSICDRDGTEIAAMHQGQWVTAA